MPDKILRVTIYATCFGQQLRTVVHFRRLNFDLPAMALLAGAIENQWLGQFRFLSCGGLQYYNIRVEIPLDDSVTPVDRPLAMPGLGGDNSAVSLPMCGVLHIKTSDTSKRGVGRIYVPAVKLGGLQDGTWSFGPFQAFNSVAGSVKGQFRAQDPPTGFSLGVTNKIEPQVAFKEMIDVVPRLYPGTQVRRQFHRGS